MATRGRPKQAIEIVNKSHLPTKVLRTLVDAAAVGLPPFEWRLTFHNNTRGGGTYPARGYSYVDVDCTFEARISKDIATTSGGQPVIYSAMPRLYGLERVFIVIAHELYHASHHEKISRGYFTKDEAQCEERSADNYALNMLAEVVPEESGRFLLFVRALDTP